MKRFTILSAAAMVSAVMATAQINSTTTDGYMARGLAMLSSGNYNGCIDQLGHVDRSTLSAAELEQVDWALAEAAFGNGGASALPHFKRFLAVYPYSQLRAQAQMRVGDCLFTRSYPEALKAYLEVPGGALNADLREDLDYRTAYCMLQTADFDGAAARFSALAHTRRYGPAARFYTAYIAYARGNYAEAARLFAAADSNTEPGCMSPYYLAQIHYRQEDFGKSLAEAQRLLKRRTAPEAFKAEAERIAGESLYRLGRPGEAVPYLRKYVAAAAEPLPSSLYILGLSEYADGDYSAAVSHLESVTGESDAMAQSAYLYIGQALMHSGDVQPALLAFDKAVKMDFDPEVQETAYYNYAVARMQGGRVPFGSSVETLEDFLRRYPASRHAAEVQEYIVAGYMTDNNYEKALASIERMKRPADRVLSAKQTILYTLGSRKLAAGQAAEALPLLREADGLASKGDAATVLENKLALGEALYNTGDYAGAADALLQYVRRAPTSGANTSVARYDLGYTRFAQKRYDDAATNFRHAVENSGSLSPEAVADAYNRLGDTRYYATDFDEAEKYYDKAFATNPSAGDYALFQKGVMQGYRRNHRAKLATLDDMMRRFPSSSLVPDALLESTESHIQLGDNRGAIALYRRLVSEYPGTAQGRKGHLQMAQTMLNTGDRAEAIDTYKDIIRSYPTSGEAAEAVEALKRVSAEDGTLQQYIQFLNSVDNAPKMDVAEADRLSYEAADKALVTRGDVERMLRYANEYPDGAYRARAVESMMAYYSEHGQDAEALQCAEEILRRYPDNAAAEQALVVKAETDYAAGRGEAALRSWRQLEQRASSPSKLNAARLGIMRTGRDTGDYELAGRAADALLASSTLGSGNRTEATYTKAAALSAQGDEAGARKLWKSIADATDELYGAIAACSLAQSYLDSGDTDSARREAEALTGSGTPHAYWLARGFIVLSDVYAREGKTFEAREYLTALKANYPGTETDIFDMIDTRLSKLKK